MHKLKGTIKVAPDKSISHRGVMFSSIAKGKNIIRNFLTGEDCLSTIDCFRKMGVDIQIDNTDVIVNGLGMRGLKKPSEDLYVGNSGTTIRLIMGILSGQNFDTTLYGDESIGKRPMKRVTSVLKEMGAIIDGNDNANFTPIKISGSNLKHINHNMSVSSAQVKSAIILASLYADGTSNITEKIKSRNHTEIMLKAFGANINTNGLNISVTPIEELYPSEVFVPGDISSAAFFIAGASLLKGSEILIKDVGLNETRCGILKVLDMMNGNYEILNKRTINGEEIGNIFVKYSNLNGCTIDKSLIPYLIDEIPIIAVMASRASGQTIIKDAHELRVKESDRIKSIVYNLRKMGVDIEELEDGMVINGPCNLKSAHTKSYGDHRIAMSFSIASLLCEFPCTIDDSKCIDISFPNFNSILKKIIC